MEIDWTVGLVSSVGKAADLQADFSGCWMRIPHVIGGWGFDPCQFGNIFHED